MLLAVDVKEVDEGRSGGEPVRDRPFWAVPARIDNSMQILSHEGLIPA